jgi:ABC-type transporter Mla subunit MlaD
MSQNLVSNLTLRIEQEANDARASSEYRVIPAEHRELAEQSEQVYKACKNAQRTTENAINQMAEAKQSLVSVQTESKNLAKSLQQQTEETATLLSQQAQQLQSLKTQSAQLNSMSQEIAETAKIKKTLSTSNMVLASIALILLISSICLGTSVQANTTTSRIWKRK